MLVLLLENCALCAIWGVIEAMKVADAEGNVGGIGGCSPAEAISAGRESSDPAEQGAERTEAFEANGNANLGDGEIRGSQQVFSRCDTPLYQVLVRCLLIYAAEESDEVKR